MNAIDSTLHHGASYAACFSLIALHAPALLNAAPVKHYEVKGSVAASLVKELRAKGLSHSAISRKTGIPLGSVAHYLKA